MHTHPSVSVAHPPSPMIRTGGSLPGQEEALSTGVLSFSTELQPHTSGLQGMGICSSSPLGGMRNCRESGAPGYTAVLSSWAEMDGGCRSGRPVPWTSSEQLTSVPQWVEPEAPVESFVSRGGAPGTEEQCWRLAGGRGQCVVRSHVRRSRRRRRVSAARTPGAALGYLETRSSGDAGATRGEGPDGLGRGGWVVCG